MGTTSQPSKWWDSIWVTIGLCLGTVLGLAIMNFYVTFHSYTICILSLILLGLIYGSKIDEMKPLHSSLSFIAGGGAATSITIGLKSGLLLFGVACLVALILSFFVGRFLTRTGRARSLFWLGGLFGLIAGISTKSVFIGILCVLIYYVFYGLRRLEARLPKE